MIKEIKEADKIIDELNGVTCEDVEVIRTKLEKVTSSIANVQVQSSHKSHSREDVLLMLVEMSMLLDKSNKALREIYINISDRNLRIYFDKVYFHLTNKQLEIKYGVTKRHINRIIKKLKNMHQCPPDVPPRC